MDSREDGLLRLGYQPKDKVSRARKRRRGKTEDDQVLQPHPDIRAISQKRRKMNQDEQRSKVAKQIEDINFVYEHIERRELIDDEIDELPQLGGVYSAQMLKHSKPAPIEGPQDGVFEDFNQAKGAPAKLKLPLDGSIFHNLIPFHHIVLTALKEKHIDRLKEHGIKISNKQFSPAEDQQIMKNWSHFAKKHDLSEDEAAKLVSAATAIEMLDEHQERIKFINESQFRPYMCKRLLNRTCAQVFRRCYRLFHLSSETEDLRTWTPEDDQRLVELVKEHGKSWELIGNELMHTRFSCKKRYVKLIGNSAGDDQEEGQHPETSGPKDNWTNVELSRLYNYLCDHMARHPVLVATIPRYEKYADRINWTDRHLSLPQKSVLCCQKKWLELKERFREAKARLGTDLIRDVEREVLPANFKLISRASTYTCLKLSTKQLADCIELLVTELEQSDQDIMHLRDFDQKKFSNGLDTLKELKFPENLKSADRARRVMQRIYWLLYVCSGLDLFGILPIEQDTLEVRLQLLVYILRHSDTFRIKKKALCKRIRRFIRKRGWEPRKVMLLVDKSIKGELNGVK